MNIMPLVERLASKDNREPDDYEVQGILMCGKCHTPKQCRMDFPTFQGGTIKQIPRLLPISCQCRMEASARQKARERQEAFRVWLERQQEQYGVFDHTRDDQTFAHDDGRDPKTSRICRRYVAHWAQMREQNIGILFYGTVGTGKSFYACSIVNALLAQCIPAGITNFPTLINVLQGTWERQAVLDHLRRFSLLVIDDLGVERDTKSGYVQEQIYNIVDGRYRQRLPLIVTTNLTWQQLTHPPDMEYARIYDRILELCPLRLQLLGDSRRPDRAKLQKAQALEILRGGES